MENALKLVPQAHLAQPQWPSAAAARIFVVVMLIAATFSFIHRYVPSVLVDPIRAELGISDVQFGLLQGTAFAVLYCAAGLFFGVLADRTVRRRLLMLGVATWTIGTILFGLATSFEGLLAARCMVGLGEATLGPASISLLCDYFAPDKRARAIAVSMFGATLGTSLAFGAGGWMLQAAAAGHFAALPVLGGLAPWRQVVVILGLIGLLILPALLLFPEPPRRTARAASGDGAAALWALRNRVGPIVLTGALVALADFGYGIWVNALLTRTHHFSAATAGTVLGVVALVAGIGGGWLGGVLCDRAHRGQGNPGRMRVVRGSALFMLVVGGLLLVPAGWAAVASYALWQIAANVAYVGCASALQDQVTDRSRGLASAVSLCASIGFGLGVGPTAVAWLNQSLGKGQDFLSISLLIVLCSAALLMLVTTSWLIARLSRVGPPR
jgi:predicted MFS family arabinose efflux permease